ncbi:hypothetical protein GJ496_010734, partial [Pomphorhynchus laevis]
MEQNDEVFEMLDFTVGSDFEKYVSSLEQIIAKWNLSSCRQRSSNVSILDRKWLQKTETFSLGTEMFTLIPMATLLNVDNDFPLSSPYITHWYGLTEFITVSSVRILTYRNDENNLIQSIIACALSSTECCIPVFFCYQKNWQTFYDGIAISNGLRTMFDMALIHNHTQASRLSSLHDICRMFEEKLLISSQPKKFYSLSSRATYVTHFFEFHSNSDNFSNKNCDIAFPLGCYEDPISSIHLSCQWKDISCDFINQADSCFDPNHADAWSVGIQVRKARCKGYNCLKAIFKMIADPLIKHEPEGNRYMQAMSSVIYKGAKMFLKDNIDTKLQFVRNRVKQLFLANYDYASEVDKTSGYIRSAPECSISICFASLIAHIISQKTGNVNETLDAVFEQFIIELKHNWDAKVRLISIGNDGPEFSFCIFHQKLQLLNYCINHCLCKESLNLNYSFNCGTLSQSRLEPLKDVLSSFDNKTQIYVPITQRLPVLTEDMVIDVNCALHDSGEFAKSSLYEFQSNVLQSDIQSFKAANPWSTMEDFIRYYSPKDATLNSSQEWVLSERMTYPGNIWKKLWEESEDVHVVDQKPLFDETLTAQIIFDYFKALNTHNWIQLLLPLFLKSFYLQCISEAAKINMDISKEGQSFLNACNENQYNYDNILDIIYDMEIKIEHHRSLYMKLIDK